MRTTAKLMRGTALAAIVVAGASCGSGSSTPSHGQPSSGPGAKAAISNAFSTLFDLANPALPPKIALIQDGKSLEATLSKMLHSPIAKAAGGAKVLSTTPQSTSGCSAEALPSPCQAVSFDVLPAKGTKVLVKDKGFAVYIGGKWLVAKSTVCALLTLAAGGKTQAGC